MALEQFARAALNGLMMGWVYVLIALGLSLIFGILRIVQFAHGEIYMLGAYLSYALCSYQLPLGVAVVLSGLILGGVGYLLERLCFRRLRGDVHRSIIFSLGLLLLLQSSAVWAFGLNERSLPHLSDAIVNVGGVPLALERLLAAAVALALSGLTFGFLKGTRLGLCVLACAQNQEGAALSGINPNRIASLVMGIGCALAAVGGTIAGSILKLSPFMGDQTLSKGLVIIVLGGMGSLGGTVAGGLLIGLSDSLVNVYGGAAVAAIFPLILVIGILLVKPEGLFGHA